ncbi:hypothetical protein [Roseicyclus sp.]|uniref:hypothetical protein n=1 Tax=Roseicyclus sp. TaxID=1914329 RepID=UPI003F9F4E3E
MLARFGATVIGAAAVVFAIGEMREGGAPGDAVPPDAAQAEPLPSSAIDLLGDAWTLGPAPREARAEPVPALRPLARTGAGTGRPEAVPSSVAAPVAVHVPMPRPVEAVEVVRAEAAQVASLRPLPRPAPEIAVARGAAAPLAVGDVGGMRWVVRSRGEGSVIAELPIAEALALLEARRMRP